MTVTITLNTHDVRIAVRRALWKNRAMRWGVAIGVALIFALTYLVMWGLEARSLAWRIVPGAVMSGVALPFGWWVAYESSVRAAKRDPQLGEPARCTVDDTGFRVESPHGETRLDWSLFSGVSREGDYLFIDATGGWSLTLPVREFENEHAARRFEIEVRRELAQQQSRAAG